jgi:hypothetical protein
MYAEPSPSSRQEAEKVVNSIESLFCALFLDKFLRLYRRIGSFLRFWEENVMGKLNESRDWQRKCSLPMLGKFKEVKLSESCDESCFDFWEFLFQGGGQLAGKGEGSQRRK